MNSEEYITLLKKLNVLSLSNLEPGAEDIYCVIRRAFDLKQSERGNKDWKISVYISDPTFNGTDISLLIFNPVKDELEKFKPNNVLVLKGLKVASFNGKLQIQGNANRKVGIYEPGLDSPLQTNFKNCEINDNDIKVINYLRQWNANFIEIADTEEEVQPRLPLRRSLLQVDEIVADPHQYMDFIGRVVDVRRAEECLELTLTDYTRNPYPPALDERDTLNIGDDYLIMCSLWDRHAHTCPLLTPGDYVHLKNCKKKHENVLELNIHGNSEDKLLVAKLKGDNPRLEKLIERQKQHSSSSSNSKPKEVPRKRKIAQVESRSLKSNVLRKVTKSTSIENILLEKEKKSKTFFVKAYIKSFKPLKVEDWISNWCHHCKKTSPSGPTCTDCQGNIEPMYRFAFMIEDDSECSILVHAMDYDASLFFPDLIPRDACNDKRKLNELANILMRVCSKKNQVDFAIESFLMPGKNYFGYRVVDTELLIS